MTQNNQTTLTQEETNSLINVLRNIFIHSSDRDKLIISYGTSPTVYNKIFLEYREKISLPNNDRFGLLFSFTFIIPETLFTGNNKVSIESLESAIKQIPGFRLVKFPHNASSYEVQINDGYTKAFVNQSHQSILEYIIHDYYNPLIPKLINERNQLIDQNNFTVDNYVNAISKII